MTSLETLSRLGIVAIGRNEGGRLQVCLEALAPLGCPTVYVDSGSTDGSPDRARRAGVDVLPLDAALPFTAARARREGCERLLAIAPEVQWVFFVDGDCETQAEFLPAAVEYLATHPQVAAVAGRRRERHPERSRYNRLCDLEWNAPPGACDALGGDALYRVAAYQQAGGFNPSVAAGEEPELCFRLRQIGWELHRLDREMTIHDADMTRWGQWWRRQIRTGYGGWDVERRFSIGLFDRIVRSAVGWSIGLPVLAVTGALIAWRLVGWGAAAAVIGLALAVIVAQTMRIARRLATAGHSLREGLSLAGLLMGAKLPITLGAVRAQMDRWRGRHASLIEYKSTGQKSCAQP
jgi:GT2 family glycosyltransferase